MPAPAPPPRETPARAIRRAADRWGTGELIAACVDLVVNRSWREKPELLRMLAPGAADAMLRGEWGKPDYWTRTWALRDMLYVWTPAAEPAVLAGLADEHWRVREMAGKVAALREVGAAADLAAGLLDDPVARVRAVAARLIAVVGESEHAAGLRALRDDPEPEVRRRAELALERLSVRLDRDLSRPD